MVSTVCLMRIRRPHGPRRTLCSLAKRVSSLGIGVCSITTLPPPSSSRRRCLRVADVHTTICTRLTLYYACHTFTLCPAPRILNPLYRQRYILAAARYQNLALQDFRLKMNGLGEKNCYPMFVFARMVVVHTMASHVCGTNDVRDNDCGRVENVDVILEWLNRQSGTFRLLLPNNRMAFGGSTSSFKPLINCRAKIKINITANSCDSQLEALAPLFSNGLDVSTPVQQTIKFRDAVALWPLRQPQDFFDLLCKSNPKSLIVLAFYCVMLNKVEDYCYLRDHGRKVLCDINECLDDTWK